MEQRQARSLALQNLPEDMEFLKQKVEALMEHTGMPADEPDADEEAPKKAEGTSRDSEEAEA